jgi:hypothetical protein
MTGRSVLLLLGGLVVGCASTPANIERIAPLFMNLFYGALVVFLLDMGIVAAQRLRVVIAGDGSGASVATPGTMRLLVAFALLAPIVNGTLGVLLAKAAGLSFGGTVVLGVMAASASYIAAPAAVRVALPGANPGYYLTASIGITFPFNLTLGIPLVYEIAKALYG